MATQSEHVLATFTARYHSILARFFALVLGGVAIAWGIATIPVFWGQAPIEYVARHIIRGEPYKIEALMRQMPAVEAAERSKICRPIALWSAAIIRLRIAEQATRDEAQQPIGSKPLGILDNLAKRSLSCSAAEPFLWLVLYWAERTQGKSMQDSVNLLRMSYELGPNEGWIALKRNPLAFTEYQTLPPDLKASAVTELVSLVNSEFYQPAADIFTGAAWPARDLILRQLATLPPRRTEEFSRIVTKRGFDAKIPGTRDAEAYALTATFSDSAIVPMRCDYVVEAGISGCILIEGMDVTTIIPVRNRAKYIARALNSVGSQTYQSAEIIVVDDASTDETPDIIIGLAKEIPNIQLINLKQNVGAAEARNVGIRKAKSNFIAFLDLDDIWYPTKIEKQINEFKKSDKIIAVFSGSRVIYSDRTFAHIPSAEVTLADLYYSNKLSTTSSAVISRKALLEVGGFDPTLPSCQDWDLFIRLAEIGKIRVVQEELIEFLNHDEERISRNRTSILTGHEIVRDRIYRRISDPSMMRQVRGSHHCTLADIFSSLIYEPSHATKHALIGTAMAPSGQSFRMLGRVIKRICKKAIAHA